VRHAKPLRVSRLCHGSLPAGWRDHRLDRNRLLGLRRRLPVQARGVLLLPRHDGSTLRGYRTFFEEVEAFLGDKRQLVDKRALRRSARNWKALISHVHHAVEPYYVIAAVASFAAGSFSFVWSRFH